MTKNNYSGGGTKGRPWIRPAVLMSAIVVISILAWVFNVRALLAALHDWIEHMGAWGMAVYVGVYAVGAVAAIPYDLLTIVAGSLFGSVKGIIVASVGSVVGGSLCFLIARHLARKQVTEWLSGHRVLGRIDRLTETRGAIIVAVFRLVPIFPFSIVSYAFGLTRIHFRTYIIVSWLCMLPATAVYVVGADAVQKGFARGEVPWVLVAIAAGAGVALLILAVVAAKMLHYYHEEEKKREREQEGKKGRE